MEPRAYRFIFAALLTGIIACAAAIAWMLLKQEPRQQLFADAILVWEGMIHGPL